jgi:hypothetical protein
VKINYAFSLEKEGHGVAEINTLVQAYAEEKGLTPEPT